MLILILAAAAVAREYGQGSSAQSNDGTEVPTVVEATGVATAVERTNIVPTIEEIVIPTLAPGEPTPDFSLPPDASLDVEGVPALAPRQSDGPMEFTTAEIEAYLADEPHPYVEPSSAPPEVVDVNVMTARDAAYVILSPVYRPEDALVLVAELRGQFLVNGPAGHALSGQSSHMVFDAYTGNLLTVTVGE